jgi:hypothetical protein
VEENELAEAILILCIENKVTISKLLNAVSKVVNEFKVRGTIEK